MWLTDDTTAALARSRTARLSLAALKKGQQRDVEAGHAVATTPEALAAVIPTGIAAAYTVVSSQIGTWAASAGEAERAQLLVDGQASGTSAAAIEDQLRALPLESSDWLWLRVAFIALVAAVVMLVSLRAAREGNELASNPRPRVVAEPAAAVLAFTAWALIIPGTPLGALVDSGSLVLVSTILGASAGFILYVTGKSQLSRQARPST